MERVVTKALRMPPVRDRIADPIRAGVHHAERWPRWIILLPLGSLVVIGLLVMSLSRMVLAPGLGSMPPASGAGVEVEVLVPVASELDDPPWPARVGAAYTR